MGNEIFVDKNNETYYRARQPKSDSNNDLDDLDHVQLFYGRDSRNKKNNPRQSKCTRKKIEKYNKSFVTDSGLVLPYKSHNSLYLQTPLQQSLSRGMTESDKISEIEFVMCNTDDTEDVIENYKINSDIPNHSCGKNCYCIKNPARLFS